MAKKAAAVSWRPARAIVAMRDQVNAFAPNRSKISDGVIGDSAHAKTKSGHNPNRAGVVVAIDLTHSPDRGFDSFAFAEELRLKRDNRLAYVVSNARIFSSTVSPWTWRRYTLPNPHRTHVHVEMAAAAALHDDARAWDFGFVTGDLQAERPVLRRGSTGPYVHELQALLGIKADGAFGQITEAAVRRLQAERSLTVDGVVGRFTWAALNPEPANEPDEHRDDDDRDPMATSQPLVEPERGDADAPSDPGATGATGGGAEPPIPPPPAPGTPHQTSSPTVTGPTGAPSLDRKPPEDDEDDFKDFDNEERGDDEDDKEIE